MRGLVLPGPFVADKGKTKGDGRDTDLWLSVKVRGTGGEGGRGGIVSELGSQLRFNLQCLISSVDVSLTSDFLRIISVFSPYFLRIFSVFSFLFFCSSSANNSIIQ